MRLLGRIVVVVLAIVGVFAVLIGGVGIWVIVKARPASLPAEMVLEINLNAGVTEAAPDSPFAKFELENAYVLKDLVMALDQASRDPRVTAVVARLDGGSPGMARAQEIRDAILAFRKSNKRTVLYSTSLGEFGAATVPYYLATAFREIWLQPSGNLGLTGFVAESPFFKGTLDLLGIRPQFGARYEYKSAIDIFTQDRFTKESRESLDLLIDAWTRQAVIGIAEARGLSRDTVSALVDRAPLMADEARQAGLVDRLAYWDELEKELTEGGNKLIDLADYIGDTKPEPQAVKVALIYGVGAVQRGDGGGGSPLSGSAVMSAERISKAFQDAVKDPTVKAILFRIDSPGGSYIASDTIWRAVGTARTAGKPVVVSMGNVAASGGYFAAMAADRIVAQPGTITGSIGVFAGKMVLADFWKKLGVSWDEVHHGQNAAMWSANEPFSPASWDRMNAILDHIYGDFTGKAEEGRHISAADMDKIARGRIWPGDQAKRIGLVDDIGGYETAVGLIRQLARLPSQMPVNLVQFPRPKDPLDYLVDFAKSGRVPPDLADGLVSFVALAKLAGTVQQLLGLLPPAGELTMPPMRTE
jgi:protease-4